MSTPLPPPLPNTYWPDPGRLLAGEYPGSLDPEQATDKLRTLQQAGVTAFIDLTSPADKLIPYAEQLSTASHHPFPIRDGSIPTHRDHTLAILDAIDHHIDQGGMAYVHCWGGIGRTGVIVGCWLVRQGLDGEQALARLRAIWRQCVKSATRNTPETAEQARYILGWQDRG